LPYRLLSDGILKTNKLNLKNSTMKKWPKITTLQMQRFIQHKRKKPMRRCAALYGAYLEGQADQEAAEVQLNNCIAAETNPVPTADTWWTFQLTPDERAEAIEFCARKLSRDSSNLILIPGITGNCQADYRRAIADALHHSDRVHPMVMTSPWLAGLKGKEKIAAYGSFEIPKKRAIAHELTEHFVAFGGTFDFDEFVGIAKLDAYWGCKLSELYGHGYQQRLAVIEELGLKFEMLNGGDWNLRHCFTLGTKRNAGYLLGAAAIDPVLFGLLADTWESGDKKHRFDHVLNGLQFLSDLLFAPLHPSHVAVVKHRGNPGYVGIYRSGLAYWLYIRGVIRSPELHPKAPSHDRLTEERRGAILFAEQRLKMLTRDFDLPLVEGPWYAENRKKEGLKEA
jgi:hypothetical protein